MNEDTITDRNGEISASFSVSNESNVDGYEKVQIYSSDTYASITPDIKRLRAFKKVFVPKFKSRCEFNFDVRLIIYNIDNVSVLEQGEFQIHVGSSSSTSKQSPFLLNKLISFLVITSSILFHLVITVQHVKNHKFRLVYDFNNESLDTNFGMLNMETVAQIYVDLETMVQTYTGSNQI